MADLDTRNKRSSAIGWGLPFARLEENADGTIDVFDRQQATLSYSGISTGAGSTFKIAWTMQANPQVIQNA